MPRLDLTGRRFNRLIVKSFSHTFKTHTYWNCICECGNSKVTNTNRLRNGQAKSCGCLMKENSSKTCLGRSKHGHSKRSGASKLYTIWANMKQRALTTGRNDSKWYFEKGIDVCGKWERFDGFLEDMGEGYFSGASLDRVDNSKGYDKDNCRWVELKRQHRNMTSNHILTIDGEDMCMADAAEKFGINYNTLRSRVYKLGMDHKEAVTRPVKRKKK